MKPKHFRGFISSRDTIIKTWGGRAKARREYEVRNNKERVMVRAVQLPVTPAEMSLLKAANRNIPFSRTFIPAIVSYVASKVSFVSHSKTKVSQLSQGVPGTWRITELKPFPCGWQEGYIPLESTLYFLTRTQTDSLSGQYFSIVSAERRTHLSDMDTGAGAVEDSAQVQLSLGHLYILYIYYRPMS